MKNIITVSTIFSFKGKKFSPSLTLELDTYMQSSGCIPDLYPLIANANGIDLYSYEYEMMQAEPLRIEHAEGPVAEHVIDGTLDTDSFSAAWYEHKRQASIRKIIAKNGLSHILEQYPEIEPSLLEIYKAGEENKQG